MGTFTRSQIDELRAFLGGPGARPEKERRHLPVQARGSALLAGFRDSALSLAHGKSAIAMATLEKLIASRWQKLNPQDHGLLAKELTRRGIPIKDSVEATMLRYCSSELKKKNCRVAQISETALQMVASILNEDGVDANQSIYELVVDKIDTSAWQHHGLLNLLGYRVGKSGLCAKRRRAILRDAYRVLLVPGSEEVAEYLHSWGNPLTQQRLSKITGSIGCFMALARNKNADYSEALADWQDDLNWLGCRH